MKICLVNPPLSSSLYTEWDLSSVDSISPPLGLLLVAAVIRQEGHDVSIIDSYANRLSAGTTAEHIVKQAPDLVGFTATTPSIHGAAEVAKLVKESRPDMVAIVGGAHITAVPHQTLELFPQFDIGILGEGEKTIIELLKAMSHKEINISSVNGIIFRENGRMIRTGDRPVLTDMDSLPFPAWDLLPSLTDPYRMSVVGTVSDKSTAIVTSRGCPGKCSFCDTSVFGKRFRGYSAEYVISMIEHLMTRHGIEDFLIYDDTFVANRERLMQICRILIEKKYRINWSCCARVNMVNPEMLSLMKKAGCWQIEYGIESGSPDILKIMHKGITIDQIRQALTWTREAGILTRGNFIFGYLGETSETMKETLKLLLEIDLDYFQQTFLTPYPGSEVYRTAGEYGRVDLDWTRMSNMTINFIPAGLSEKELVRFSKKAFLRFYLRPHIILTQLRHLKSSRNIRHLMKAVQAYFKTITR